MVLKKIFIIIAFPLLLLAGAGNLFLFPFYSITSPYGSLLFLSAGEQQIYLDGFRIPDPIFDLYPQLPSFKYSMEKGETQYHSQFSEKRELFVGTRKDFGLRGNYGPIFLQLATHEEREGREYSILGIKKWERSLLYVNFYRNYSFFTGKWRNVFLSSFDRHGENLNIFAQIKSYASSGNNETLSLFLFSLSGDYQRDLGTESFLHVIENIEIGYGKYRWKEDRIIYLNESPLMKVSYPGYSYRPFKSETLAYVSIEKKRIDANLGASLTYIGNRLFPHPYVKLNFDTERVNGFIEYRGVTPPLESLYGLNRKDHPETFYSWNSGWSEIGRGTIIQWDGAPGPFHRIRGVIDFQKGVRNLTFKMGAFFIRDWGIPEDKGIWGKEYETKVSFQEKFYPIWIEENLRKYHYSNFSELWRERKGAYIGVSYRSGGIHLYSYLSFKETEGTYPFEPYSYYPGDFALYSSTIMNQKNTSPEFVDKLKSEYGWGDGPAWFIDGEYSGKGFELGGYFYLFRNPPINSYLLISGLPQESFFLPLENLGKDLGEWNFTSGMYLKINLKKFQVILEGVNFFRETNVLKTVIDGKEMVYYPFPPQRILIGIGF